MFNQRVIVPIAGAGVLISSGYYVDKKMSTLADKYPFVQAGLALVPASSSDLRWFKTVHVDSSNNVGYATMYLSDGRRVRITAREKTIINPVLVESSSSSSVYDDLYSEGSGIAFYWENPWEIKASLVRGVRELAKRAKKIKYEYIGGIGGDTDDGGSGRPPENVWELTSVSVGEDQLVAGGDNHFHPDFASMQHFSNTISSGRERAQVVLLGMCATALLMGARRTWLNYIMWPGYTFAQNFILTHPAVKQFYGGGSVEIISRTGEFSRSRINAELTVKGGIDSLESAVRIEARLAAQKEPHWIVSQATMTPPGCDKKPIDLLTAWR